MQHTVIDGTERAENSEALSLPQVLVIRAISGCSIRRDKSIKAKWLVWLSTRLTHFHYEDAKPVTVLPCPLSAKHFVGIRIRYVWNCRNSSIPQRS